MTAGHLDGYRAGVIAFELEVAPADVADAVVAALSGHFGDDSSSLRRRTRVLLSRISPDLVRERAQQARNNTGLRRWVAEPGVDEWHGTFPSEDAASAWAAIDRLAHDLVAAGTCSNIEQARGKALTDLVTGNATIDVQIVLTVPADSQPAPGDPRLAEAAAEAPPVGSATLADGEHVPASTAGAVPGSAALAIDDNDQRAELVAQFGHVGVDAAALEPKGPGSDHPVAGAATAPGTSPKDDEGPSASAECADDLGAVTAGAQHDVITDTEPRSEPVEWTDGPGAVTPGAQHAPTMHPRSRASDDDLVEVQGSRPSEPLLVRRGWLQDHVAQAAPDKPAPCEGGTVAARPLRPAHRGTPRPR